MKMNITFRLAIPADAPDMAEIHMRSWEVVYKDIIPEEFIFEKNSTRYSLYKRVITDDNKNTYVIQLNGKTVGIMRVAPPQDDDVSDDFYELHYIYLHPDCFRKGIGTKALIFAFDIAHNLEKKYMNIWVLADNINSRRFYEYCGFIADGKIRKVEYGKALDCIRMRKTF
jgi:RimJ/RimL family protein N-acetyltransferase